MYLLELGPNVYNKNKYISRSGFKREFSSCIMKEVQTEIVQS